MLFRSLLLSCASISYLSAGTVTNYSNLKGNFLWDEAGNWTVAVPKDTDEAIFTKAKSSWFCIIGTTDANAGSVTIEDNTEIQFDNNFGMLLYPSTFDSYGLNVQAAQATFTNPLISFVNEGVINNDGSIVFDGGSLFTSLFKNLTPHLIVLNNQGTISLDQSYFLNQQGLGTLEPLKDSVIINGGDVLASNKTYFLGQLLDININNASMSIIDSQAGVFSGTVQINNSFISLEKQKNYASLNLMNQGNMVLNDSEIETFSGTALIGPGSLLMNGGIIDNNAYILLDRVFLVSQKPVILVRGLQESIFEAGTISSSLDTGSIYISGTAIFKNDIVQNEIQCGRGVNLDSFNDFLRSITESFTFENTKADLIVNGNLEAATVYVSGSGTLFGVGTITGDVVIDDFGTLSPGTNGKATRSLNIVNGNVILSDNTNVNLDFDSLAIDSVKITRNVMTPTGNLILAVNNPPNLNFNLTSAKLNGSLTLGNYIPLFELIGGGTISGFFNVNLPPELAGYTYNQTENLIYLSMGSTPSQGAKTANELQVENILNELNGNTSACLQSKIDLLNQQTGNLYSQILASLQPADLKGQQISNEEVALEINTELLAHLNDHKKGLRLFLHAGYRRLNQNSYSEYNGFHANAGYQMLGLFYGYDTLKWIGSIGASEIFNTYKKGFCSSEAIQAHAMLGVCKIVNKFQASLDAMYIANFNQTNRHIPFYGLKAHSHHQGNTVKGAFDMRYRFDSKDGDVTLYDTVSYLYNQENGFTEKGADCLNLHIKQSQRKLFRNEVGIHLLAKLKDALKPYVDVAYIYENRMDGKNYVASFIDTSPLMRVSGINPNQNFVKLGMGLTGSSNLWGYKINLDSLYGSKLKQVGGSFSLDRKF